MDGWALVRQGRSAELGNWRTAPHNKWGFHNVNRILTTDLIDRRTDAFAALGSAPRALGDIRFTAPGGNEMTVSECLKQSDTDSFLVLKDNKILHEQYANGMEPSSRHVMFSVSKSILGALFGILKDKGLVDTAALATDYVPELKGSAYDGATVQHILDMQVAVEFTEDYNAKNGDVDRYRRATGWDPAMPDDGEVATRKMLTEFRSDGTRHGEKFHYVSPNTDAAGWIAERATGLRYAEVLSKYLWQPMGAEFPAYITVDKFGAVRAAGGICACLRDIARFGTLMTRRPLTEGVLPKAFVDDVFDNGDAGAWARGASSAFIPGGRYRNKWYIKPGGRRVALAIGIHGQWIHVDHDRNIVIAKQSSQPLADQPATEAMLMACFDAIAEAIG